MGDLIDSILSGIFDVIYSVMQMVLDSFIGRLMYYAETGLCKIVGMLDQMFRVFAGIDKAAYDGKDDYLVNIFFNNHSISNVYWAMALIGIAMVFGFAIAAVTRKMFDSNGKMQTSLGQIITAALRSIFLILGLSAIMVMVLNSTNVLMKQINYAFTEAPNLDVPETIVYTDEDFAAMGRVLNTIGNYSLNPSYSSCYNINTCFNEIRNDLNYLQQQNVFRYYYTTRDANGNEVNTWQAILQKIAFSHDLRTDLKLDINYDAVTSAILEAMTILRSDPTFRPLESYKRVAPKEGALPLDRYLFLMGTMHAAKNKVYNEAPELLDPVRGPYYSGEKNIYNVSQVTSDFDIGFATDYLIVFLSGIALIFDLVTIILNCIARIFNMLFLYLIAPLIFATQPFDGGGKSKQWLTAFIVQAFSVFGTVIAMRLLMILLPIVTSSRLQLFPNSTMDTMAKLVLIYGLFEVAKKATGLLTGILADSAGWQSVQAGDMSSSANKMIGGVAGAAKAVGKGALKVADFATKPVQNLAKQGWESTGGQALNAWNNLGKGDVAGKEAMAAAQKSIAVDDAKQKILSERAAKQGGGDIGGKGAAAGAAAGAVAKVSKGGGDIGGKRAAAGAAAGAVAKVSKGARNAAKSVASAVGSTVSSAARSSNPPGGGSPPSAPAPARDWGSVEDFLRDESDGDAPTSKAAPGGNAPSGKSSDPKPTKTPPPLPKKETVPPADTQVKS